MMDILNNESSLCAECGRCCTKYAGMCWPDDVKPLTLEKIVAMLKTGYYSIDWWEGDPREDGELGCVYMLRPAHTNRPPGMLDPSWFGTCRFLSEGGCSLPFEDRPTQCRALIPMQTAGGDCEYVEGHDGKEAAALAWIPHQKLMEQVVHEVRMAEAEIA